MKTGTRLNRDFYIKMRLQGYSHETIALSVFPPERKESFCNDVSDLEEVDYKKKINIEKLIEGTDNTINKKNKK